jgi:hypothetical protein
MGLVPEDVQASQEGDKSKEEHNSSVRSAEIDRKTTMETHPFLLVGMNCSNSRQPGRLKLS